MTLWRLLMWLIDMACSVRRLSTAISVAARHSLPVGLLNHKFRHQFTSVRQVWR